VRRVSAAGVQGKGHERLRSEAAFVAGEGEEILGFAHAGIRRPGKDRAEQGVIRFLCYQPGHRAAGQALLFYTNHGYRVVDWAYGLAREIA